MRERWRVYGKKADFNRIAQTFHISPVTARIIRNRDVDGEDAIRRYLYGTVEDLYDPRRMKDMGKAADLVEEAVRNGVKIAISSDFDVDGIFSGMILLEGILRIGGEASVYTPDRVKEGYGLNDRIVEEAHSEGYGMILTCDNGIAAAEPILRAKELGMTVVVTDHHEVPYTLEENGERRYHLPAADAVVDHKQEDCPYPFKKLCGAGVTYKLIQILYERFGVEREELYRLLEYAAIATVADVMDLEGENRIIVREGLRRLGATKNLGLQALMEVNGMDPKHLTAYHIGFIIGPCFNAAGRLETVKMAFDLLKAKTREEATARAETLKELNDSRKNMTLKGAEQAVEVIEQSPWKQDKILLVRLHGCHESLVGIIAGRIREKYYKPVFVFTDAEEGIKGSGRSIEGYHMFDGLMQCQDLLERFGGHAMAAGLSLKEENLEPLRKRLNDACTLTQEELTPLVQIDVPMPLSYITEELIEEFKLLEPFGKGNTKPIFAQQHFQIAKGSIIGKNKNVMKFQVIGQDNTAMEALYFGDLDDLIQLIKTEYGEEQFERMMEGRRNDVDLAFTYYPSVNEFRGRRSLQIVIQNYCRIRR
ncbi:MAG TPA: single-stranded-DNA-specific exonuclease RecJ [Candidatus Fimimorpha excrementavium]|nr:single-stranded-DNA-specific exonuclease RecJ [Candidatus Fimimorpha excrementavium]